MFESLKQRIEEFKRGKTRLIEESSFNQTSIERVCGKRRDDDLLEVDGSYINPWEHYKKVMNKIKDITNVDD